MATTQLTGTETREQLMELTRKVLHGHATDLGWETSKGNKKQLTDFILQQQSKPTESNEETVEVEDGVHHPAPVPSDSPLSSPESPPEPEDFKAEERKLSQEERGSLIDALASQMPMLVQLCEHIRTRLVSVHPDAAAYFPMMNMLMIASHVLADCKLRGNPHAAFIAFHNNRSHHANRLGIVLRRAMHREFGQPGVNVPREVWAGAITHTKRSLPEFFAKRSDGQAKVAEFFEELDRCEYLQPPKTAIAAPLPEEDFEPPVTTGLDPQRAMEREADNQRAVELAEVERQRKEEEAETERLNAQAKEHREQVRAGVT